MTTQKPYKKFQSQSEQSSGQQVVELSIKKKPQKVLRAPAQPIKKIKKIDKKQKKETKPKINSQLRKLLQERIEDEKLLKQLQKGPLNFGQQGSNNKKILLIQQSVKTQKKDKNLGINLIYQKKALPRKGTNRLSSILAKTNHLRKDMQNVRKIKLNRK